MSGRGSLFDRLPPVPQDRTFAVTFGRWGGFYRKGKPGFWRVCLGFVAVTYFRAEFTQVVAAWIDRTDGRMAPLTASAPAEKETR